MQKTLQMITNNKKICVAVGAVLVMAATVLLLITSFAQNAQNPTMYLQVSEDLVAMSDQEFYVDIKIDNFPEDGEYPAASFSLDFDKTKLQFDGLSVGTMTVGDTENSPQSVEIPTWQCNTEVSNQKGSINALYVDMTASDGAYRLHNYKKDTADILLRLDFTLLDSAAAGESIELTFTDAVLAGVDENGNEAGVSTIDNTLVVRGVELKIA